MNIGAATDVGLVREHNEDAYWYSDYTFVVCDGMGGHQAGEVASRIAVETIMTAAFPGEDLEQEVEHAILKAHQRIGLAATAESRRGMGTTITMGVIHPSSTGYQAVIGHVGDSRAYLLQGERFVQVTDDHSIVGELVRNGDLTEEEALHHPHRHVVTQALGVGLIEVDISVHHLSPGDTLLLCSDGLTSVLDDARIRSVLETREPQQAADEMIRLANSQGGPDNITALIVNLS